MFVNKTNPVTGEVQKIGGLELVQLPSEKWLQYTNTDGEIKHYKLANAVMKHNGTKIPIVVSIAKKTLDYMVENNKTFNVGESYLCTLSRVESTTIPGTHMVFARMSYLQGIPTDHTEALEALGSWEEETVEAVVTTKKQVNVSV